MLNAGGISVSCQWSSKGAKANGASCLESGLSSFEGFDEWESIQPWSGSRFVLSSTFVVRFSLLFLIFLPSLAVAAWWSRARSPRQSVRCEEWKFEDIPARHVQTL